MAKKKQTGAEIQLKARRTSLGKKSNEELINIILRKDKTERKLNAKVNDLTEALDDAVCKNVGYDNSITRLLRNKQEVDDLVKAKQENINNLLASKNSLEEEVDILSKKLINIKNISKFRKNIIFTCFSIIAILILLLVF